MFRVAICKGGLFEPTVELLKKSGYDTGVFNDIGRQLVVKSQAEKTEYIICRPTDVTTYIENGAADVGIVGKDIILETKKNVFELLDLTFGKCELVLAEPEKGAAKPSQPRIATKYPRVAQDYFAGLGQQVEIVKLHGNIELAPVVGLAEQIVDLVSTGKTLKDNNLVVVDKIFTCTARLISNRVSQRLKFDEIMKMVSKLSSVLENDEA